MALYKFCIIIIIIIASMGLCTEAICWTQHMWLRGHLPMAQKYIYWEQLKINHATKKQKLYV